MFNRKKKGDFLTRLNGKSAEKIARIFEKFNNKERAQLAGAINYSYADISMHIKGFSAKVRVNGEAIAVIEAAAELIRKVAEDTDLTEQTVAGIALGLNRITGRGDVYQLPPDPEQEVEDGSN